MFTNEQIKSLPEEKQQNLLKLIKKKGEEYGVYPLTAEQRRMWFLYVMNTENTYYNSICEIEFDGIVALDEVERTVKQIINRHSILRTIFITISGIPYQVVNNKFNYKMEYLDLSMFSENEKAEQFSQIIKKETNLSFDLTKEIPIKTILIKHSNNKYKMLLKLHHICFDGWSIGIFINDFINYYKNIALNQSVVMPKIKYKYSDYALWQNDQTEKKLFKQQLDYWSNKLKKSNDSIRFNYEKQTNSCETVRYNGSALEVKLSKQEFDILKSIAAVNKTSIYVVTMTLLFITLSRNTEQSNINIGTPVVNRQKKEYEDIFGFFANTVVINAEISEDMHFLDLLEQVKETVIDSMENQDVPFDLVVDKLNANRNSNMSPLFQVMFSLRNETLVSGNISAVHHLPNVNIHFKTLSSEYVEYIQFKLIFTITQLSDSLLISLGYNTDKLDKEYMKNFLEQYRFIIQQILENRNLKISQIKLSSPKCQLELKELLSNKTIINYQANDELIESIEINPTVYAETNNGLVCILDNFNNIVNVGLIGNICFKPFGQECWYYTGDTGYWSYNGKLKIKYRKYDRFLLDDLYVSVESIQQNILNHHMITDCKVTSHTYEDKIYLMVYYTGGVTLSSRDLSKFVPLELKNKVKLLSYKTNYLPLDRFGNYDVELLKKEIYEKFIHIEIVREKLQSIDGVNRAVIYGETFKPQIDKINIKKLYSVNKHEEDSILYNKKLSNVKGGELSELPFKTLPDLLDERASTCGEKLIRIIQYNMSEYSFSYTELRDYAYRAAQGLYLRGVRKNDKVIIMTNELGLFIKSLWGCFVLGAVPVPLGVAKLINSEADANVFKFVKVFTKLNQPTVITSHNEESAFYEIANKFKIELDNLYRIEDILNSELIDIKRTIRENDTAIILFTSGSTGMPKGVKLTHRNILKRSQATTICNSQNEDDISLNWMPLDHVGGVVMFHIRDVFGGIEQIQVETCEILKSPLLWLDYINKYRVTLTWAPNFAYGLIVQNKKEISSYDWDLSCLRFILNGGEMISERISLEFLKELKSKGLSSHSMYPSWGMSETSSGVLFSKNFGYSSWNEYVEVGEPIPGVEFRVIDENDKLVPQGIVGSLQIRGETVTKGYYDDIELNSKSFSPDGWFITGDLAVVINDQITLTGRNNDIIIINGVNYTPTEIENFILESVSEIDCVVACGVRDKEHINEKLAIFYVHKDDINDKIIRKKIQVEVSSKFGLAVNFIVCLKDYEVPKGALEKIQRKKIKQNFENGIYDDRINEINDSMPNWFYKEKWIRSNRGINFNNALTGCYLIFCEDYGLGELVGKKLEDSNCKCFYVYVDTTNSIDGNKITLNLNDSKAYEWLFKKLYEHKVTIDSILHLFGYGSIEENNFNNILKKGIYSLKDIFKNISSYRIITENAKLFAITNFVSITDENDIVIPEKATISAFIRSAQLEIIEMNIVHIDFEGIDVKYHSQCLVNDINSMNNSSIIAYRERTRLIPTFKSVKISESDKTQKFIKRKGLYVVVGGLGGIGVYICNHLIEKYNAELVILGKTDLNSNSEKAEIFSKLSTIGKVHYSVCDISVENAFSNIVSKYEEDLNYKINGIFNLAGSENIVKHYAEMNNHLIINESKEYYKSMFEAKVFGTKAIFEFLKEREDVSVVNFTSCNSVLGGNSFSGYSAANSFVNAATFMMRKKNKASYICINWSMWDGIGMCEDIDDDSMNVSIAMGYRMISPNDGISSMECLLQRKMNNVLVGIDGSNKNMNMRFNSGDYKDQYDWKIYYSTFDKKQLNTNYILNLTGYYDVSTNHLEDIPLTEEGNVNYIAIIKDKDKKPSSINSFTELEVKLFEIWSEILGHSNFDIQDKFFEIGGNSIKSIQVVSAINKNFNTQIEIVDLFKYTSIDVLANYISGCDEKDTKCDIKADNDVVGMTF